MTNVTADEQALLAEIVAHPEEDTPRLAYADLLDEIGGEKNRVRAEFIRLQIKRAECPHDPFQGGYNEQEMALLKRFRDEWVAESRLNRYAVGFDRGFVGTLVVTPEKFVAAVRRANAPLWSLLVDHGGRGWASPDRLGRISNSPLLARFTDVSLAGVPANADDLRCLASSPHLHRLEGLDLGCAAAASPDAVRVLTDSPAFRGIRRLGLQSWDLGSPARRRAYLDALTRSVSFQGLQSLDVTSNGTRAVAAAVVRAGWRLRHLFLGGNKLGCRGAAALAEAESLSDLSVLDLASNGIGNAGAVALARSPVLSRLKVLDLGSNRIGTAGALALANSPTLGGLEKLVLVSNPIDGVEAAALRDRFGDRVELMVSPRWLSTQRVGVVRM